MGHAPKSATTRPRKQAVLAISSRNYSSWCLRGFLLARLSGIDFVTQAVGPEHEEARSELLMRTPSIRLPTLIDGDITVWDTLAIAEYLNEAYPGAHMLPAEPVARARCRSISGEMHAGFTSLRASLPMNIRGRRSGFTIWSGAQTDVDRVLAIWRECLLGWGGPFLFGARPSVADAMFAPVVSRFRTYDVPLDALAKRYCDAIFAWPDMAEWVALAEQEPEEISELDTEF